MSADHDHGNDAQTTPIGVRTVCPQCGAQLDSLTTTCGACGAVVTGGAMDTARMDRVRGRLQEGIGTGYRLGDMLGRGGMGIVFQARELALDRDVALKVLAFDPILNPEAYARFEREARLAARLDHPNIVPIFAVGQGNGIAFYTMRMVRGGSVEALVAAGTPVATPQALAILKDVAAALDYAHGQGVVHRDIKPANVLLGDSGHAMVADFGIARAFGGPASSGATGTGTGVIGSPAYMSPEQWRGEKVDGRADQYALGVLAFELLAGTRPFAGDSMQELLRMHLQEEPPDIISVRHDLPSHLTDAIRRAMAKDPGDRFASSSAFVAALAAERVAPSAPSVPSASTRAPASVRPSTPTVKTPVPAGGGRAPRPASAVPPTGAAPAGGTAARGPARPAAAASSGERRSMVPWLSLLAIALAGAGIIWKLAPSTGGGAVAAAPAPPAVAKPDNPKPSAPAPTPAPAVNLDSIAAVERGMQAEIARARRQAMMAEHRADSIAAGASRVPAHAHLYVFAQGGTPQVLVDGTPQPGETPTLLQLAPGSHSVSVRGLNTFAPAETTITLAAEDTRTVIFRVQRGGGGQPRRGAGAAANERAPANELITRNPATGKPVVHWPAVINRLGFDPRAVNPRTLTPQQRMGYRRFQQLMDSLRRASSRQP